MAPISLVNWCDSDLGYFNKLITPISLFPSISTLYNVPERSFFMQYKCRYATFTLNCSFEPGTIPALRKLMEENRKFKGSLHSNKFSGKKYFTSILHSLLNLEYLPQ